jgi:sigma-B regulation protein RsbU (phosphoserine phosphatase)
LATPSEVARKLNEYFPFDPRTAQYFTLLYGILDPKTYEFDYVAAGHQPPIHLRASGTLQALETTGPPVGMLPNPEFERRTLKLDPGDRVYLCTDGVIEAETEERQEFGADRLFKCLAATRKLPVQESLDVAMSHVSKWCGAAGLHDDASMLAFEIKRD